MASDRLWTLERLDDVGEAARFTLTDPSGEVHSFVISAAEQAVKRDLGKIIRANVSMIMEAYYGK